jgi:rfaE bifunctional protein kinase chain/domain
MNKSDIEKIKEITTDKRVVFVYGKFNILHPGHLRLLKFAKDSGDILIVGVDGIDDKSLIKADLRLEALLYSKMVDYAFLLKSDVLDIIAELKPDIVVKGSEYEDTYNKEQDIIDSYGGKLIFNSGDIRFSSFALLQNEMTTLDTPFIQKPTDFIKRHKIKKSRVVDILNGFDKVNALVIGDTILDEYIMCDPLGMSQEDPTIVVTPIRVDKFLGGAGIVSAHASGLGAKVDFFTILGDDEGAEYVDSKLKEYNVQGHIYKDSTRPTTLKQRYRANSKTLLRVNHLKQHHISIELQDKIYNEILEIIDEKNLVVFADFSYGCLPQRLVDKIIELCSKKDIMMVADSQSSSQTGDISKFKNMYLVAPTEREIRLSINDFESGLVVLSEKLRNKSNIKNVFVTLGSEGMLIHAQNDSSSIADKWITDKLEALNSMPKDVAGAGDSLIISAAMSVVAGATIMESAYIGSLAAAQQVSKVGNIPLNIETIKKGL